MSLLNSKPSKMLISLIEKYKYSLLHRGASSKPEKVLAIPKRELELRCILNVLRVRASLRPQFRCSLYPQQFHI